MSKQPYGYRLEWKPGDYCFLAPEAFDKEICKEGARIWPLFDEVALASEPDVVVYKGSYWVQPKHVYGKCLDDFMPLYLGPQMWEPMPHFYSMSH